MLSPSSVDYLQAKISHCCVCFSTLELIHFQPNGQPPENDKLPWSVDIFFLSIRYISQVGERRLFFLSARTGNLAARYSFCKWREIQSGEVHSKLKQLTFHDCALRTNAGCRVITLKTMNKYKTTRQTGLRTYSRKQKHLKCCSFAISFCL